MASLITELWAASKQPQTLDPSKLQQLKHDLDLLVSPLRAALPYNVVDEDFGYLLDILIPSWETLWRVVAAAVAHTHTSSTYREVFSTYLSSRLHTADFRQNENTADTSVEDVVLETMRLHPPSKHISRWVPSSGLMPWTGRVHAACVLEVQTSTSEWGADASEFKPTRERKGKPFMAFGVGPLSCKAKDWAPVAIAIIVADILEAVDYIEEGQEIGGREGWVGWAVGV